MRLRATLGIALLACASASIFAQPQNGRDEITVPTPSPLVWTVLAKNGSVVAGVCEDHQLRVWALPDTRLLRTLDVSGREFALAAVSDNGRWLLFGDYRGGVTVWDSSSGEIRLEQRVNGYLTAAVFSRDGKLLAMTAGTDPVRVFDLASNRILYELPLTFGSGALAFSRDGALIASADGDGVRVHDARAGKVISQNSDFPLVALTVDFTRDGKQVIAAGGDKVIAFIDVATGKTLRRTRKTADAVGYLEVSPDGTQLAAVTFNAYNLQLPAPVVFWDIASLQKKAEWISPKGLHFGFGAWTEDGHFFSITATPDAFRLLRVR